MWTDVDAWAPQKDNNQSEIDSGATAALYQKTRLVHRDSARQHRRASPRRFFSF